MVTLQGHLRLLLRVSTKPHDFLQVQKYFLVPKKYMCIFCTGKCLTVCVTLVSVSEVKEELSK